MSPRSNCSSTSANSSMSCLGGERKPGASKRLGSSTAAMPCCPLSGDRTSPVLSARRPAPQRGSETSSSRIEREATTGSSIARGVAARRASCSPTRRTSPMTTVPAPSPSATEPPCASSRWCQSRSRRPPSTRPPARRPASPGSSRARAARRAMSSRAPSPIITTIVAARGGRALEQRRHAARRARTPDEGRSRRRDGSRGCQPARGPRLPRYARNHLVCDAGSARAPMLPRHLGRRRTDHPP